MAFLHFFLKANSSGMPFVLSGVVTDRYCKANAISTKLGIENSVVRLESIRQTELIDRLEDYRADIVVCNIHVKISDSVLGRGWRGIVNLHYSLLPSFGGCIGSKPVENAIKYKAKFTGVTVHHLSSEIDAGVPIVQCAIPLLEHFMPLDRLMEVVFRCGCLALLKSILAIVGSGQRPNGMAQTCTVNGLDCVFSGGVEVDLKLLGDEVFWNRVKENVLQ